MIFNGFEIDLELLRGLFGVFLIWGIALALYVYYTDARHNGG